MGAPRKYKTTLQMAIDADKYLQSSMFNCEIEEIILGNQFSKISACDRAKLLETSALNKLYIFSDINNSEELLKRSAKEQQKFITDLKHRKYHAKSRRRTKTTKKEKEIAKEIFLAENIYYRLELQRAQIVLLGAEPGSIIHCRNIVNQIRKKVSPEYWRYSYIIACCDYIEATTYRFARTSNGIGNFDTRLKDFLELISFIESKTGDPAPEWIQELVHETWVWQAVQMSRRGNYSDAFDELILLQSGSPYWSVYLRANIQCCFIEAFKLRQFEEVNQSLDRLKKYDMIPDIKFMWHLTKVYCQKNLGRQSDDDYKDNVICLNRLIKNSGSLLVASFKNEIKATKNIKALA